MNTAPIRGRMVRYLTVAALATCIGLGVTGTAIAQSPDCAGRGVPTSKVSIQLWTFAEYVGFGTDAATIARLEEVLRRLSEMGYRNVEPFTLSGLTAEQYRALLDKYGLKASARHVDVGTPENPADIEQIIDENRTLGIKYFGSGATPNYATEAEWIAYAEYLNELGERARKAGQTLMVHNHDIEFERVFGDQTVFDILMANTDPRNVVFQLDLYWATNGGADPVELLERYGNRIQLFHVKDMRASVPPDRDRRRGDHRLPGDLRGLQGTGEVLRRRARPALRRPDVRPVRGSREGLRLSRLRDVLSACGGGPPTGRPSPPRAEHTPTTRRRQRANRANTHCRRRRAGALGLPVGRCGSGAAARLAVPEGRHRRLAW